jgi:nitrite reductase/ring-hydroxylating ferredoxin subunit
MTAIERRWVRALSLDEVPIGGVSVYRGEDCQVAVFRVDDETLYAVDNRCPHEGYPLDKGYVVDCVVTCPWHNFKFDLRDGNCIMGDEAVRTFELRLDGRDVLLDVTPPDLTAEVPRLLRSLEQGFLQRKLGQMARDVVRLLVASVTPKQIALETAKLDAAYAQYGTTHAMAVAVDGMRMAARFDGAAAVLPLMQALDIGSESHRRRSLRKVIRPSDPGEDPAVAGERLVELVEAERSDEAEALLRGALAAGWPRAMIEPWFYRLCAAHFLDFGHALIYQVKLFELLDTVGWDHADELLPAHLFSIVNGTREELLPEWLWLRRHWEKVAPRTDELYARCGQTDADGRALFDALCDGGRDKALDVLLSTLEAGTSMSRVVDAISAAAAERMLRFDVRIDAGPTSQDNWLDVTHAVTFAAALRRAVQRWRSADVIRLLWFAARFVLVAKTLDGERAQWSDTAAVDTAATAVAAIVDAVADQRASDALGMTEAYLDAGGAADALRLALEDIILADPLTRPIVVAHAIKTLLATFDEHAAIEDRALAKLPVLAAVRLLASPIRERRVARFAHEAVRFVVHGKVPKTLT